MNLSLKLSTVEVVLLTIYMWAQWKYMYFNTYI